MKKFHWIWIGYGKKQRFIHACWVHEDAIEAFKKAIVAKFRSMGWEKEFCFIENSSPCVAKENSSCHIGAIGPDGKYGYYGVA
jgi:hypothetical protein